MAWFFVASTDETVILSRESRVAFTEGFPPSMAGAYSTTEFV